MKNSLISKFKLKDLERKKISLFGSVGVTTIFLSLSAHSALTAVDIDGNVSNGHEAVYDDVLDITWLANANLGASNTFGVSGVGANGTMSWHTAEALVSAMNDDNSGTGYLGVDTWRQPTVAPVNGITFDTTVAYDGSTDKSYQLSAPADASYNANGQSPGFTGSELAYHFYNNFGAIGACYGSGQTITACQSSAVYGIDNAPDPENNKALFSNIQNSRYWTGTELDSFSAFFFSTNVGRQSAPSKINNDYLWVVAPGNVAANAVPVPASAWLFGSAILGLAALSRK